jgi:hypothetical protein
MNWSRRVKTEIPTKTTVAARRRRERRKESFKFYIECLAALATVSIAGFTAFYVHYSNEQWQTMQRQGANSEAAQRADLIIEDFRVENFPTAPNVIPYATFTVRNAGNTVANEISVATSARIQTRTNMKQSGRAFETNAKLAPSPSGWSLAPGRSRSDLNVEFELGPETRQVLVRKRSTPPVDHSARARLTRHAARYYDGG